MSEYYAVQRSGDSLAHYGVRGMKWGVKKAIASGNDKALSKQFKKAEKKLAKLEKRGANGKKYAARAAKLGAAGAALGAAGALGSFENIKRGQRALAKVSKNIAAKSGGKGLVRGRVADAGARAVQGASRAIEAYGKWGSEKAGIGNATRHGAIRVGAMAAGAGLVGAAAHNAYRAATAKKNRQKAAEFKSEMKKAFAGTKYANGASAQSLKKTNKRRASTRG